MDFYCFVEWKDLGDSKMPALPEDTPFLLLSGDPDISKWALLECELPDDFEFTDQVSLVDEELEVLLYSANGYPPALALTRDDFEEFCYERKNLSKEDFSNIFKNILKQHLQLQRYNQFFLAEAKVDEEDYIVKGAYYWIVGFDFESSEVEWVSDDFYVYQNPCSDFGLDPLKMSKWFSH